MSDAAVDDTPSLRVDGLGTAVVTITLARPASRNAMGLQFFEAFDEALDAVANASTSAHVVLLRAEGRAFCAGFDLGACAADPRLAARLVERLSELSQRVRSMPAVVVASVQGPALAGGCALVASCDIVIATTSARFGYPVHRIGISPAVSLPILARSIGGGAARTLALGGELIDGARAQAIGLVHELVEPEAALPERTQALVESLAAKGPGALRATKKWLNELDRTTDATTAGAAAHASMGTALTEECHAMIARVWER